nr:PD-(D/E)XK nuclease family protein [Salinigranum halophilum]
MTRTLPAKCMRSCPSQPMLGNARIVGKIDHLRVTADTFVIPDYKTNSIGRRSTEELASHYRPQMISYAAALLAHDSDRSVIVNLYFIDVGVTESVAWTKTDHKSITDELQSLLHGVDDER